MIITGQEIEYLCDELCRYPRDCADQEELDEVCANCLFTKKMKDMANEKMDVVLSQDNKEMATEVMGFLNELNQKEQREFMNFLQGAKFAMTLKETATENRR